MQIKKTILVFVFLLPFYMVNEWSVAANRDSSYTPLIDKFQIIHAENTSDLPDLQLLKTALSGYELLKNEQSIHRTEVITIIDFSLPSDTERLWVIDLVGAKVLYHCLVSHGRNSGDLMAEKFSNNPGSYTSSPGFYTTGESYFGKHGLSLRLDGIEKGINDKARERAIVIHGADYVSPDFVKKYGRLGRSLGCPAIPEKLSKEIIETIKDGSCLFVFTPTKSYLSNSRIITKITAPSKKG
ncbi:MAG: murein L,D-transpeptidase catalytic domain family protein [Bacteroidetes bacterium]|nr:murein L,D-transpeptidase catalytic domain family protein [Bacteroidota bacterium]MBU1580725.1 murein L,D-transpeptidase catalytic domain family protein [Bacteroidota bacterium]MBU2556688.1 murein L,D-transpeptidase catalytic domain family protein [Bacteroidota bacterium]